MKKFVLKLPVTPGVTESACELLSSQTGLSKSRVKDAMNKGAVWVRGNKGGMKRLRKATAALYPGECIELHYDENVLSLKPPQAACISDQRHYSVWYKPVGLMAQGTMFGDHCSLIRQAELYFKPLRKVFLVHRLDREAWGIMLVAHSSEAAAKLSGLFRENRIIKRYFAEVHGRPDVRGGRISFPLDGRPSETSFEVRAYDPQSDTSKVDVIISTGRRHQIRRHFEMIGHPVMGDPKYGRGNKNTGGMRLVAVSLKFRCPFLLREVEFALSDGFSYSEER